MPIAAVPSYMGSNFKDASPALRFGLLLPVWTTRWDQEGEVKKRAQKKSRQGQDIQTQLESEGMDATIASLRQLSKNPLPGLWDKNDFAARIAWNDIKVLSTADKERMKALADRQAGLAETQPSECLLRLDALAVAPFTTGLGNEHPLENGFSFINPYGLPYLPGSGVKGVLRQAARELAGGEWGESHDWSEAKRYDLPGSETVKLSMLDVLFGRETAGGDTDHLRGALVFWDVIPQIIGNSLTVEIMTPHQGHYYQGDPAMGSATPHESGQPNPISFLTVPPRSGFIFYVQCDLARLRRVAPELAHEDPATEKPRWKMILEAAFTHAFDWLGFGAKTAVGYGQMRRKDGNGPTKSLRGKDSNHGEPYPTLQTVWENAVLCWDPGSQTLRATVEGKKAEAKITGDRTLVSDVIIARLKKKKTVRAAVKVEQVGNGFRIIEVIPV